jgi:hypothetical protein
MELGIWRPSLGDTVTGWFNLDDASHARIVRSNRGPA